MSAQTIHALSIGNEVRMRRAELKRELRSGRKGYGDLFRGDPPPWLATEQLHKVLRYVPQVGDRRVMQICNAAKVNPFRRMGMLTTRQRREIVVAFEENCPIIARVA